MAYLEYEIENGHVVGIYESIPATIKQECKIAIDNGTYKSGDEFEFYIIVTTVDESEETPIVVSTSAVRQAPAASYILEQLAQKDAKIAELEQIVADLSSLLIDGGVI